MNKTKKRILEASRMLYNQFGVAMVSQRRIAEQLDISPGNLTYHFKKSDDIVEALYFELVVSMDEAMVRLKDMQYDLVYMLRLIDIMVESFFEYRFIFLDFVQIMRNNHNIKSHYGQLSVMRKRQFMEAIQHLISTHILRAEELPNEYDFLYNRFQLLADFWISSAEIKEDVVQQKHIENYKKGMIQSIYPYLTDEGKKKYHALVKS